jgi:hypothetical protein
VLDKHHWMTVLANYRIDGNPVFDLSNQGHRSRLESIVNTANQIDLPGGSLESRASLQKRLGGSRVITDDNMGTEWLNPTVH